MITSSRNVFIGAHVTVETREALEQEAAKRNVSKSKLINEAVVAELVKSGHDKLKEPEEE